MIKLLCLVEPLRSVKRERCEKASGFDDTTIQLVMIYSHLEIHSHLGFLLGPIVELL